VIKGSVWPPVGFWCGTIWFAIARLAPESLPVFGLNRAPHIRIINLQLTVEETVLLEKDPRHIIDNDHYFLSLHIRTLRAILNKIRSEPKPDPLPSQKHYEPPRGADISEVK
jgi:hypothetical protein